MILFIFHNVSITFVAIISAFIRSISMLFVLIRSFGPKISKITSVIKPLNGGFLLPKLKK